MNSDLHEYFESHHAHFAGGCRAFLPRGYCDFHQHDALEIIHQHGGDGVVTTSTGTVTAANRQQVLLLPASVPHDHRQQVPGETFNLLIALPRPIPNVLSGVLCVAADQDFEAIRELHTLAQISQPKNPLAKLSLDHSVTALFLRLLSQAISPTAIEKVTNSSTSERIVNEVELYLRNHFRCIERVEEIANYLHFSPDYLRHLYKSQTGFTMSQRLTALRLDEAKTLLSQTGWPIKRVAHESGFQSESYFSRCFFKSEACTPGEFRRKTSI